MKKADNLQPAAKVQKIKIFIHLSNGDILKYLIDPTADMEVSSLEPEIWSFSQAVDYEIELKGRVLSGSHLDYASFAGMWQEPS